MPRRRAARRGLEPPTRASAARRGGAAAEEDLSLNNRDAVDVQGSGVSLDARERRQRLNPFVAALADLLVAALTREE